MTSQWSSLRAPFNKDACVNNFPLFQVRRHNGPWKTGNTAHTCTDHNDDKVRWKFDSLTQTFCKSHDCHFHWQGMHLENRDLGIWNELFQNKVRLFIKGCDEDKNKSPTFSMDSTWHCSWLKVGWHLTMVANSTYEALVESIMKAWPKVGPLLNRFDSSNLKRTMYGFFKTKRLIKVRK